RARRPKRLPIPPERGPRPAWRLPWPALAISALIAIAGCNKHASDTVGRGTGPPPPGLIATQPAARATFVLYHAHSWRQFSRALDSKSVSTLTVFLKLDAQRVPITVRYEPVTRRILITPTVILELQRTYTVEFSTNVHASDGTPLAPGLFFQFTTNSL